MLLAMFALLFGPNFADLRPSPQQVAWQDLEVGVLVHFGPNTFTGQEWGDGTVDPARFHPSGLDAGQWARAARAAGARYLILVAKHHDGFCLWPSGHTRYSVAASPWRGGKGDLVGEVSDACRKYGLKFGLYLSPWDRHEPSYANTAAYDRYYTAQVTELATRYGPLVEWWLDGAGSEGHVYDFDAYGKTLRTYQPNTLFFADVGFLKWGDVRWAGNEDGSAPEENWNVVDRLGYLRWRPAECDTPLRARHWFWHRDDEGSLKSLAELLAIYHRSVGRGAQLVIGLAPDDRGLLPESDAARLAEFGKELERQYGKDLAAGAARTWTVEPGGHAAQLTLRFARPVSFGRTVAMEQLEEGQRVAGYEIQALEGGRFRTLASGTTIGHKKIDVFPPTTAAAVRLRITSALDTPRVRSFRVY